MMLSQNKIVLTMALIASMQLFANVQGEKDIIRQAAKNIRHNSIKRTDYLIAITMPKCGTHLILKCLDLLKIPGVEFPYQHKWQHEKLMPLAMEENAKMFPDFFKGRFDTRQYGPWPEWLMHNMQNAKKDRRLFSDHWPYTPESEALFEQFSSAGFFMFRDPRDMLVSMAYFVHKGPGGLVADVNAVMFDFIDARKKSFVPWAHGINLVYPLLYDYGVTDFYKLYLKWIGASKFLAVKFEDLVGPKGGGTLEAQLSTIKQIVQHLGIQRSDEFISNVAQNLFGESATFREGKIGGWRNHFTQEMIDAYKKVPGACQLLIDLGYEKDANW
jgi:hypothetical protein